MARGLAGVLVVVMLFSVLGCKASQVLGVKEQKEADFQPYSKLTPQENYTLETWYHAAVIADDVEDYTTAIMYYTKISDYFPDTKEGDIAEKRLEKLNKTETEEKK